MTNPIYIIGNNALAYYLGAQLQSIGDEVIILTEHNGDSYFPVSDGFSLKEDRSLTHKKYQLKTADLMRKPAKMVIITAYANKLNTALSRISTSKIGKAPVVCFTLLKNMSYLSKIVSTNLHQAFFNGYVTFGNGTVSLLGRETNIIIFPPEQGAIDPIVTAAFGSVRIQMFTGDNRLARFWEYFAPYALCSLLTAAENAKISDLLKNKKNNDTLHILVNEFRALAAADGVSLNESTIMKGIFNTPSNYIYPLHQAIINNKRDEFNLISSVITDASMQSNCAFPHTHFLLKKLYNMFLSTTL